MPTSTDIEVPRNPHAHFDMSWVDVEEGISTILGQFREAEYSPEVILAVAKGGVIPASLIHQAFPTARFHVIHVGSYDEFFQHTPRLLGAPPALNPNAEVLIVDDILETGATRDFLQNIYTNATFAFLTCRHTMAEHCRFRGKIYPSGWVSFPWERELSATEVPF